MAERRMFAKTIIKSDAFLDMPATAKVLYFYLMAEADDDGFVNSPRSVMRNAMCTDDDMKVLIAKRFVILFDSGVIVIKHWRMHNYIRTDRYKPTVYTEEMAKLTVKENGAYSDGYQMDTVGIPSDYQMDTQISIGKNSIGKSNNNGAPAEASAEPKWSKPTVEMIAKYAEEKGYNIDAQAFYDHYESNGWMVGRTHMKKWKAAVANWARSKFNDSGKGWAF